MIRKTLIDVTWKNIPQTVVEGVTEEEWNNLLCTEFANAEIDDLGLYIPNPILLDWEEINGQDAPKTGEQFINWVNNYIENSEHLYWCESVDYNKLLSERV